jgi:hypothetical protein
MPLFSYSSGVQINGGNFYEIARDMNIESTHPLAPVGEELMALPFGPTQGVNRPPSEPERQSRDAGAARGEFQSRRVEKSLTLRKIFLTAHDICWVRITRLTRTNIGLYLHSSHRWRIIPCTELPNENSNFIDLCPFILQASSGIPPAHEDKLWTFRVKTTKPQIGPSNTPQVITILDDTRGRHLWVHLSPP